MDIVCRPALSDFDQRSMEAGASSSGFGESARSDSLDFEFMFEEKCAKGKVTKACSDAGARTGIEVRLLRRLLLSSDPVQRQVSGVVELAMQNLTPNLCKDPMEIIGVLNDALRAAGFQVSPVSFGGTADSGLLSSPHSYLEIVSGESGSLFSKTYVIDPQLHEQFQISRATPQYESLLRALPASFVGTRNQLFQIVDLMCQQMTESFKARGMATPPWRQVKSMKAKWQPRAQAPGLDPMHRAPLAFVIGRPAGSATVKTNQELKQVENRPLSPKRVCGSGTKQAFEDSPSPTEPLHGELENSSS